jgi:RNA polymerase sigma factor (TIGR02999 family)
MFIPPRVQEAGTQANEKFAEQPTTSSGFVSDAGVMSTAIRPVVDELRAGRPESLDELSVLLYSELREIAHRHRIGRDDEGTLATTAIVHEAYLKLVDHSQARWNDRAHFLALAAMAMRHILADRAKARIAFKRGGVRCAITLDEQMLVSDDHAEALLEIDEALERLAAIDARLATIVQCRFFGGLTNEEIGEALGLTERTVERDWAKARIFLRLELTR